MYKYKLASKKLTAQLAAVLLEKARDEIPALLDAYASGGRTITDGNGVVYGVYVVSLLEELRANGYELPKKTTELGSW